MSAARTRRTRRSGRSPRCHARCRARAPRRQRTGGGRRHGRRLCNAHIDRRRLGRHLKHLDDERRGAPTRPVVGAERVREAKEGVDVAGAAGERPAGLDVDGQSKVRRIASPADHVGRARAEAVDEAQLHEAGPPGSARRRRLGGPKQPLSTTVRCIDASCSAAREQRRAAVVHVAARAVAVGVEAILSQLHRVGPPCEAVRRSTSETTNVEASAHSPEKSAPSSWRSGTGRRRSCGCRVWAAAQRGRQVEKDGERVAHGGHRVTVVRVGRASSGSTGSARAPPTEASWRSKRRGSPTRTPAPLVLPARRLSCTTPPSHTPWTAPSPPTSPTRPLRPRSSTRRARRRRRSRGRARRTRSRTVAARERGAAAGHPPARAAAGRQRRRRALAGALDDDTSAAPPIHSPKSALPTGRSKVTSWRTCASVSVTVDLAAAAAAASASTLAANPARSVSQSKSTRSSAPHRLGRLCGRVKARVVCGDARRRGAARLPDTLAELEVNGSAPVYAGVMCARPATPTTNRGGRMTAVEAAQQQRSSRRRSVAAIRTTRSGGGRRRRHRRRRCTAAAAAAGGRARRQRAASLARMPSRAVVRRPPPLRASW